MTGPAVVDYSFARPNPADIKAAGYQGVVRYLSWLPNAKVVTRPEAEAIWAAGLDLALVWESTAQAASGGRPAGQKEGAEALRQADAVGWPADRPVYFVLEDPTRIPTSSWPAVADYCRGLQDAGWPVERVGGYGSQALIEHLLAAGLIGWGWQVGGWSPTVSGACHLYQRTTPTMAGPAWAGDVDEDAVLKPDWGGWHPGQTAAAPVQPAAGPTPLPAPIIVPGDPVIQIQPFDCTTDPAGWVAVDVPLPPGATVDHVLRPVMDWASAYDPGGWNKADASVDYQGSPAGQVRIVVNGAPNHYYTGRIPVAVA